MTFPQAVETNGLLINLTAGSGIWQAMPRVIRMKRYMQNLVQFLNYQYRPAER